MRRNVIGGLGRTCGLMSRWQMQCLRYRNGAWEHTGTMRQGTGRDKAERGANGSRPGDAPMEVCQPLHDVDEIERWGNESQAPK